MQFSRRQQLRRHLHQIRLSNQPGQRREIDPDISQHSRGASARLTVNRQALQAPLLQNGVAPLRQAQGRLFRSVTRSVIQFLPGRRAKANIPRQTNRAVSKTLADIDDEAAGAAGRKPGTLNRGLGYSLQVQNRRRALSANAVAEILTSLAGGIVPIGQQAIAKRTKGAAFVIIAPVNLVERLFIRLVSAQVNDTPGMQVTINNAQNRVDAKSGVAGNHSYI